MSIIKCMTDAVIQHVLDNYDIFKILYGMLDSHEEDFIAEHSFPKWPLIKELRKENCLTQKDIAGKIGISRVAYQNIENGKSTPRLETMTKLISIYKKEDGS